MRSTGVIMEISSQYLIVVTKEGLFKKLPRPRENHKVGQIIEISTLEDKQKKSFNQTISGLMLAIIALTICKQLFFD